MGKNNFLLFLLSNKISYQLDKNQALQENTKISVAQLPNYYFVRDVLGSFTFLSAYNLDNELIARSDIYKGNSDKSANYHLFITQNKAVSDAFFFDIENYLANVVSEVKRVISLLTQFDNAKHFLRFITDKHNIELKENERMGDELSDLIHGKIVDFLGEFEGLSVVHYLTFSLTHIRIYINLYQFTLIEFFDKGKTITKIY